jgi:hypothetical protein
MFILTEKHYASAAAVAKLYRQAAGNVRRPAAFMYDNLVISVGVGETTNFYVKDWNIYMAQFSVDAYDRINWFRCDDEFTAKVLAEMLERLLQLALWAKIRTETPTLFRHWCSVCCWESHGRSQLG